MENSLCHLSVKDFILLYKYFSTCVPALHPVYWDCSKKCFSIQRQNPSYNKEIRPMSIGIPSILCSSVPFGKSICPEPKRPMLKFFSNACTSVLSKCVHVTFVFSLSYRSMYDVAFFLSLLPLLPSSPPPCPYFSPLLSLLSFLSLLLSPALLLSLLSLLPLQAGIDREVAVSQSLPAASATGDDVSLYQLKWVEWKGGYAPIITQVREEEGVVGRVCPHHYPG